MRLASSSSTIAQLPRLQEQPLQLQPAVAVLLQRLDDLGTKRSLAEQHRRRGPPRNLIGERPQIAQLQNLVGRAGLRHQEIARPGLHLEGDLQRGATLAKISARSNDGRSSEAASAFSTSCSSSRRPPCFSSKAREKLPCARAARSEASAGATPS